MKVLFIVYHIIYLREIRRLKSKSCRRMRRPTADLEDTVVPKVSEIVVCLVLGFIKTCFL